MKTSAETSLARLLAMLRACAAAPRPLSFTELARAIEPITPATLSRMLKTLCAHQLLRKLDSGVYTVGPELSSLAALVGARSTRAQRIHAHLARLADATGQSALYAETHNNPQDMHMKLVDKVAVEGAVAYGELGKAMFVLAQGFGLGLVSQYPEPLGDAIIEEHCRRTGEPSAAIRDELAAIRADGVLVRAERFTANPGGVTRIVAPVRAAPFPPGSIGITVFGTMDNVLTLDRIAAWRTQVRTTADTLSAELQTTGKHKEATQ